MKTYISLLLICVSLLSFSQTQEHNYEVSYKDKPIGNLYAKEQKSGSLIIKDLRTKTKIDVIAISVHVESEVKLMKKEGILIQSTSYRHANRGAEEILANIKKVGEKEYEVVRNDEKFKLTDKEISFCTVDLYFIEPIGLNFVFSSMLAEFLKIELLSPGRYKLSSPNSKDSYYTYKEGKLILVEIDTPLGMVSCKLIK